MKTKLIFSTQSKNTEQWTNLPFVPRINEWFNLADVLKPKEINAIQLSAYSWSGNRGTVQSVEYRHDNNDFYVEIFVLCEDLIHQKPTTL